MYSDTENKLNDYFNKIKEETERINKSDAPEERLVVLFGNIDNYIAICNSHSNTIDKIDKIEEERNEVESKLMAKRKKVDKISKLLFNEILRKVESNKIVLNTNSERIKEDIDSIIKDNYISSEPLFLYNNIKLFVEYLESQKNNKKAIKTLENKLPSELAEDFTYLLDKFQLDSRKRLIESWIDIQTFLERKTDLVRSNENILFNKNYKYHKIQVLSLLSKNMSLKFDRDEILEGIKYLLLDIEIVHNFMISIVKNRDVETRSIKFENMKIIFHLLNGKKIFIPISKGSKTKQTILMEILFNHKKGINRETFDIEVDKILGSGKDGMGNSTPYSLGNAVNEINNKLFESELRIEKFLIGGRQSAEINQKYKDFITY